MVLLVEAHGGTLNPKLTWFYFVRFQYSEFGTRTETSDQEITEGALPDSEVSDSEGPDLNFRSNNHNEMTEDFSLRSEDQTSKYADFIENV